MNTPLEQHLAYAKEQLEIGNYGRVERAADELINRTDSPFVKEGLLYKALAILSQTRTAEAMTYFDKSITDFPDFDMPYFYKCELLMSQDKLEEARQTVLNLCALDESSAEYLNILVTVDEYREDFETVVQTCDKVLANEPNHFNFLFAKASAKSALSQYQESIEAYLLADKVDGIDEIEKAYIYNNIGMAYTELKDYEKAKSYLEQSLAFDQPHPDAADNLEAVLVLL